MEITINAWTTGYLYDNTLTVPYPSGGWDSRKKWREDMEHAAAGVNDLINEEVETALNNAGYTLDDTGHEFDEDEMTITYQIKHIDKMEKAESASINEAMGISKEWKILTDARIEELIDAKDTVSEVLETEILTIKEQEFGAGSYQLTPYERKIALAGFLVAQEIHIRKMKAAAADAMLGLLASRLGIDPNAPDHEGQ
jgi:hypothetical protein